MRNHLTVRLGYTPLWRCVAQRSPKEKPPPAGDGPLRDPMPLRFYGPLGGFLPPVATNETQSPWFLNSPPKFW